MPKRKQMFFVCTGKDCKKKGIKKTLNDVSKDVKKLDMLLVQTKCLDLCKRGPNVILNNEFYTKVDATKIRNILSKKKET